jgi:hypothetical protein
LTITGGLTSGRLIEGSIKAISRPFAVSITLLLGLCSALPPSTALGDLEDYLRLHGWKGDADQEERDQILEHVKALRRRVAAMN